MSETKLSPVELLRNRINAMDCFDKVEEVEKILKEEWSLLSRTQVDALRLQVEIQFKKLAKIFPDLKATELSIGDSSSKVQFIIKRDVVDTSV